MFGLSRLGKIGIGGKWNGCSRSDSSGLLTFRVRLVGLERPLLGVSFGMKAYLWRTFVSVLGDCFRGSLLWPCFVDWLQIELFKECES